MRRPEFDVAVENTFFAVADAIGKIQNAAPHLARVQISRAPSEMAKVRAALANARRSLAEAEAEITRAEECR